MQSPMPVNRVVCKLMMFSNVIVDITNSCCLFVFSQSSVEVPASLRAGSHFRCYKRCGTSGKAASYESARGLVRADLSPTRNSRLRRLCHIFYNNENESLLAG